MRFQVFALKRDKYQRQTNINPTRGGGGRWAPRLQFFAYPDKKIIDNLLYYWSTFSILVYIEHWWKKIRKKSVHGGPRGHFLSAAGRFLLHWKLVLEPWPPNTSRYKRGQKTKNVPLDEIYLECGLRFELESFVWALEPKNWFLAFLPCGEGRTFLGGFLERLWDEYTIISIF